MAKTVVGLFDHYSDAQAAVSALETAGFNRNDISIVANEAGSKLSTTDYVMDNSNKMSAGDRVGEGAKEAAGGAVQGGLIGGATGLAASLAMLLIPGIGPVLAFGPLAATLTGATLGAVGGGVIGGLTGLGVPKQDAELYHEGIRRGGTLVTVHADDNRADEATMLINRFHPVDIDERGSYYKQSGYKGYVADAQPIPHNELTTYRTTNKDVYKAPVTATNQTVNAGDKMVIPVVEEELKVGKRAVEGGGARVHTFVTERPVQEQVTLREEHVTVERHAVDRAATGADTFREGTVELREHSEEAVVSKDARVVEEVVVGKTATERTETIKDTVRRTDVNVEELNTTTKTTGTTTTHK